jgi:hypothetical protein
LENKVYSHLDVVRHRNMSEVWVRLTGGTLHAQARGIAPPDDQPRAFVQPMQLFDFDQLPNKIQSDPFKRTITRDDTAVLSPCRE